MTVKTPAKNNPHEQQDANGARAAGTSARMQLDERAIEASKSSIDEGVVTPSYGPWRDDLIQLLNEALATEITCVLRYRRHYFTVDGVTSPAIKAEFLVHANEELAHADKLAVLTASRKGTSADV